MRNVFTLLVILTILGLSSCKKDSNDPAGCSAAWATEVQSEVTALSNALTAYSSNPTTETCLAYKNAYQDYIDAIEPFLDCQAYTAEQIQELQDIIDEAEADIATLCAD